MKWKKETPVREHRGQKQPYPMRIRRIATTKIISAPTYDKHHYLTPPEAYRNFMALKATALDASKFPILAAHWDGILIVDGKLAVNDNCSVRLPKGVRYE